MATTPVPSPYRTPSGGASLQLSFHPRSRTILILGSSRLAATRAYTALDADARVLILAPSLSSACDELRYRVSHGEVEWRDCAAGEEERAVEQEISKREGEVVLVCVTDTLLDLEGGQRSFESAARLHALCRRMRVPLNVADHPWLCDFSFPTTHRFPSSSSPSAPASPLQLALTTNARGCRLASRLKREIIAALPADVGDAVTAVGRLRERARTWDDPSTPAPEDPTARVEEVGTPLNEPVRQLGEGTREEEDGTERALRRMRWVAQVSEYWPLRHLAEIGARGDVEQILSTFSSTSSRPPSPPALPAPTSPAPPTTVTLAAVPPSQHALPLSAPKAKKGTILLLGSGPGSPSLLTLAAHRALTTADVVLSDKLVPQAILALVPRGTDLRIARKFPGNAEGAQSELMEWAVEAAREGKVVVRLKQGDPFVYGRGGEEVLYFRSHGFPPIVIPGISSSLAGPLLFNIPVTQRGAADSLILCTGVGRGGRSLPFPPYFRSRTLLILMGVARLPSLLPALLGAGYPPNLPIAIIEQASSPSQRMVASTLSGIEKALEAVGEQRPPGMMCVGWSVLALEGEGDMGVLDEGAEGWDEERVRRWLGGKGWVEREGLGKEWRQWVERAGLE